MPSRMTRSGLVVAVALASGLWLSACGERGAPAPMPAPAPAATPAPAAPPPPPPPAVVAPAPMPVPVPALPPPAGGNGPAGGAGPPPPGAGQPAPPPVFPAGPDSMRPSPKRARPPASPEVPNAASEGPPATAPMPRTDSGTGAATAGGGGGGCAAAGLTSFPWPDAPQPSVTATIAPYLLSGAANSRPATLQAVAARLEGAIARAGYLQPKYLGAGCNGFAVMLDLEHIEADGSRARGAAGFAPPGQDEGFSLAAYVRRLFYAPPGHYRQIVFVVSSQRIGRIAAPPTEAELRAIAADGLSALPGRYAALPYTPQHVVLALVYEFDKGPRDGDARVIPPQGRLGAAVHLRKAQLF